ncbi:flagellar basal body P-ring formation chaperone FlgA [Falsiroseomonas sp. CW058]|uniref:flagellar basal body P-ring formation chaperone FlgA n=1 Tax=Falsiroseomonas sp. CW058 TaxID=3388664 RepID=UPI003D310DDA
MRTLLLLLLLAAAPARAELATLRPFVVVDDAVLRLGDIFEGAGPRAAAVLGPAPAPGARLVVEAPQLLAIARSQGIGWRPVAGADRVVVERPGRAVASAEVVALLRAALRHQGLEEEAEVELQAFAPPMVPQAAFAQLAVEGAALDAATSRFAAVLVVAAEGTPTLRLRVTGRVVPTVPMLVAARRLALGEVVGTGDVRLVRVPASRLRPGAAQRADQVVGQAMRRPAGADQPLLLADLAQPVAVERGATVTMVYEAPGMQLTAQGRAMEAAARGAAVAVMNIASRQVVEAVVVAPGRVRVGAGR